MDKKKEKIKRIVGNIIEAIITFLVIGVIAAVAVVPRVFAYMDAIDDGVPWYVIYFLT